MVEAQHPYAQTQVSDFQVDDRTYKYFSLPALADERYQKLPYSIRVLLESAVRNCDNFNVKRKFIAKHASEVTHLHALVLSVKTPPYTNPYVFF